VSERVSFFVGMFLQAREEKLSANNRGEEESSASSSCYFVINYQETELGAVVSIHQHCRYMRGYHTNFSTAST
jgi:hypothetical protein